jgi:hypothetical protein
LCELGPAVFHAKVSKFQVPADEIADAVRVSFRNWGEFVVVIGFLPASILHALASDLAYRYRAIFDIEYK